jgi:hypothetical protein
MGYSLSKRDTLYGKLFTEKDPDQLVQLLNENGIRYVAIDNGLRSGYLRGKLNEPVFKRYFETVFEDKENRFGALIIYRVPDRVAYDTGSIGTKTGDNYLNPCYHRSSEKDEIADQKAQWPQTNRLVKSAKNRSDQIVISASQRRFPASSAKRIKIGNMASAYRGILSSHEALVTSSQLPEIHIA